jgi:hypothetical protein
MSEAVKFNSFSGGVYKGKSILLMQFQYNFTLAQGQTWSVLGIGTREIREGKLKWPNVRCSSWRSFSA